MTYNISGKALKELRTLTKENPSGVPTEKEAENLWAYIQEYCQIGANKNQTHFCFESAGEVYEVDIIGHSLTIYKHNWKPQSF